MSRPLTRHTARTLLIACVGLVVLVGARLTRSAQDERIPRPSAARPIELDARDGSIGPRPARPATRPALGALAGMVPPGEDDDQPAGACWLPGAGVARGSCVCSAGMVEDLMTPDFMRVLLTSWRDAGRLTIGEWRDRLHEVDAACGSGNVAP